MSDLSTRTFTLDEVADCFKVDTNTVGYWARTGKINGSRVKSPIGGHARWEFTLGDVDEFLKTPLGSKYRKR